ncbi:signal recognition particle-docking protein FtsY [Brachybacterium saurashtrense]|uniref:Signal recognition particle receptor FtsY n=1 Tax=Brachybacterium saurashtrense TaxID=556288 RepID=A0A345YKU4_9MICO|nr:signal recognition particle-docking protein FtsY [Brachybacterium saurashtrense]RRR23158.1 signal recognition particle-docking protein FtsY [Brachybacterium saurashtrense]
MDPDALLAVIAGGGGGVLIIGAGAWAYIRSRGRKGSSDGSAPRGDAPAEGSETGAGAQRTATAVKERPAAPTWADTLSAPAPPKGAATDAPSVQSAPTDSDAETAAVEDAPAATAAPVDSATAAPSAPEAPPAAPADEPFDQETAPETGVVEGGQDAEQDAAPDTTAPAEEAPTAPTSPAAPAEPAPSEPAPEQETSAAPSEAPSAEQETVDAAPAPSAAPAVETPEAPGDRMVRLRERLSRSGALGRGILTLLTRGSLDEDTWDEIEETLLMADLGPDATDEMLENLRRRLQVLGTDDPAAVRDALREELVALVDPTLDRRLAATRREAPDGTEVPSVLLMVGVNGTGKTTTVGKLARVLVAAERSVVLGAADTFRAAAAEQLTTWGSRVGVDTVRADREGADPAAVAFDAVKEGIEQQVDVVIIDTAGRLQNKKGLMDELGKVRRVAEKGLHGDEVAEVLLVIDATTGQNGMQQARVFSEAVNVTGIVLTKLDGTAKGGIVVNVQRELGVPVKMVGLGEGMDDLTPFDPHGFVDALLEA